MGCGRQEHAVVLMPEIKMTGVKSTCRADVGTRQAELYFLPSAPTCPPPAAGPAEGAHCMPRSHRPLPATIRRQTCSTPADRQRGGTLGGCRSAPAVAVLKSAA